MSRLTRIVCGALALLVLAGCGQGQQAAQAQTDGPALWRLRDEDSEIWLLGTAHMLPPDLAWQTPKIEAALAAADTVMFETPIDDAGKQDIGKLAAAYGRNAPGVTLSSLLTPADRETLARVCKAVNADPAGLEDAKPWLAAVGLSVSYVVAKGFDPNAGAEQVLDAKAAGKKRAYFETGEQQIRFFADLPIGAQVEFLRATLAEIETQDEDLVPMNKAWARGDTAKLAGYFAKMDKELSPQVYNTLIRDRNERWVTQIREIMAGSGKTFIAVGAAHLIGEGSVVTLLRKQGYKVEGP
jgi:uncharacterized protein YbaP (TraB family)